MMRSHGSRAGGSGHLLVKGDFLPAGVPMGIAEAVGMAGLQDDGPRRAGSLTLVDRTKPGDLR